LILVWKTILKVVVGRHGFQLIVVVTNFFNLQSSSLSSASISTNLSSSNKNMR
jgi:hypothetical protein